MRRLHLLAAFSLVAAPSLPAQFTNVATQQFVGPGQSASLQFTSSGPLPDLLVRHVGPSLFAYGLFNALRDPAWQLSRDGVLVAENDNWNLSPSTLANYSVSPLTPGSRDAAGLYSVPGPGPATYDLVLSSADGTSGTSIGDISFASAGTGGLASLVLEADVRNPILVGFVLPAPVANLLVRATGEALEETGTSDPTLQLVQFKNGQQQTLAANHDWDTHSNAWAIEASVLALGLPPLRPGSTDSALLLPSVDAGLYTAVVSGGASATGRVRVEIFLAPEVVVPEPGTTSLLAGAASLIIAGVVRTGRRRRRAVNVVPGAGVEPARL